MTTPTSKQAFKALRAQVYPLISGVERMMIDAEEIPLPGVVLDDMGRAWDALNALRHSLLAVDCEL